MESIMDTGNNMAPSWSSVVENNKLEQFSNDDDEFSPEELSEKDETELELERLVFGDDVTFKNELKSWDLPATDGEAQNGEDDAALAALQDSELFFLDSAPDQNLSHQTRRDVWRSHQNGPPAWEDSDDDRMMISLTSVPRLKKLRHFEGEDVISAREYQRRLRQQFEILNPRPQWANWMPDTQAKKRRREDDSERFHESDVASDSDLETDLSTEPLAKLLRSNGALTKASHITPNKRVKLHPEVIGVERMRDISPTQPSAITSLSIHPTLPMILSSGPSSTLYLHHLKPNPTPPDPPNPLITSLHLKHTPLTTTAFSHPPDKTLSDSPTIYLSSRRRYFHIWDLSTGVIKKVTRIHGNSATQRSMEVLKPSPCGRYIGLLGSSRKGGGVINILDANTTFWIAQVTVESRKGVADFVWWSDGEGITVVGRGGEVNEWDMHKKAIMMRWNDEGAVGVTTMAMGGKSEQSKAKRNQGQWFGPDRYVAIGSTSGIVNVYDRAAIFSSLGNNAAPSNPKPLKMLDQLTTPISHLHFSPCGQLMVMASRWKRDALRLVHLPSCTVYKNWPTSKTPLGRISAVALGEWEPVDGGGKKIVLMVGNEAGALRGWEVGG